MTKSVLKPYIEGFTYNLHAFSMKQQGEKPNGAPVTFNGPQKPGMDVDLRLYLGEGAELRDLGVQSWGFGNKVQPATALRDALPAVQDVLSPDSDAVKNWVKAIEEFIAVEMPAYNSTDPADLKNGIVVYPRINRIECKMPWADASQRFVGVTVSLYEDEACTSQFLDAGLQISFAEDAFVARIGQNFMQQNKMQGELTEEGYRQIREGMSIYSLKDFLAKDGVVPGILELGENLFSTLIERVNNYKSMDLATIMGKFALPTIG